MSVCVAEVTHSCATCRGWGGSQHQDDDGPGWGRGGGQHDRGRGRGGRGNNSLNGKCCHSYHHLIRWHCSSLNVPELSPLRVETNQRNMNTTVPLWFLENHCVYEALLVPSFVSPFPGRGGWGRGRGGGNWGDDYMQQDEPMDRRDGPPGWKKGKRRPLQAHL